MRVCFLLESLSPSGGVGIVTGHAARLAAHGIEAEIVLTRPGDGRGAEVPVRPFDEARGERYDVALATWWTTVPPLFSLSAVRRVVFLQGLEQRVYGEEDPFDRLGAAAVLGLPVDYVVVASWMRVLLSELRPDARCVHVPNGIDKAVFPPRDRPAGGGALRVLVEGQPSLWFKGVEDAVAAVRAMREPAELTVAALDPGEVGELGADRVVGGLAPAEMAALYAEHDVLLKLSRVESLGLPPLEAFHVGTPCVVTPFTGHEEYVAHGENGVVVGFDDLPGTSRWLDLLARDRALLGRLAEGALATAARWPGLDESTAALAEALPRLGSHAWSGARSVLASIELASALARRPVRRAFADETALRAAWDEIRELNESRDECAEQLAGARRQLDEVTSSRAYQAALAGRRALDRVRRR